MRLQGVLEVACYDYTNRNMPTTVRRKEWDCAESLELNHWTSEMQRLNDNVAMNALLRSFANIRHTAVHRQRVGVSQIDKVFTDALTLLFFWEMKRDGWLLTHCDNVASMRHSRAARVAGPTPYEK